MVKPRNQSPVSPRPPTLGRGVPAAPDRASAAIHARTRGSVLIIVLVTLALAAFAMVQMIDRASRDLLIETREADARRLRREAFSALETTLAVLAEFREVNGSLRSPAEGWGNPLEWASYPVPEGLAITVTFEDESGKLSLPRAEPAQLKALFEDYGLMQDDATLLTDAILGWMREDYVAESAMAPEPSDYERGELPYAPPARPLRSFGELRAIEKAREMFFDEDGRPTPLYTYFTGAVSLLRFNQPNLNGASGQVLSAIGGFDDYQRQQIADYLSGTGVFQGRGSGFFSSTGELASVVGAQGAVDQFGTELRALRIRVTITQGQARYTLSAVIAPPGGASWPETAQSGSNTAQTAGQDQAAAGTTPDAERIELARKAAQALLEVQDKHGRTAQDKDLKYPFTLLEIRENDDTSRAPVPSPET